MFVFCFVSRLKSDALKLYEILNEYEKRHIVEILSYHDCDTPSHQAPNIDCLVDLQARFIKQRHLIFLTGDLKPNNDIFSHNDTKVCCIIVVLQSVACILLLHLPSRAIPVSGFHFRFVSINQCYRQRINNAD